MHRRVTNDRMAVQIQISLKQIFKDKIPFILIAASILISYFLVRRNEAITSFIFVIIIPIFAIFRYDGRISIGCAILLLIFIAISEFIKEQGLTDQLTIFAYWLLVVGTSCVLIELFRKNLSRRGTAGSL